MNLINEMLNERSQTQKNTYHMIRFIYSSKQTKLTCDARSHSMVNIWEEVVTGMS